MVQSDHDEVHDETIQQLAAANFLVEGLARGLAAGRLTSDQVEERLAEISSGMRSATESVRRVVFDLAPADLSAGLLAALRAAGDRFFVDTDTSIAFDGDDLQHRRRRPTRISSVLHSTHGRPHRGARGRSGC